MDSSSWISEAYERACVEGRFEADSYQPHPEVPDSEVVHLVQFTAYDGYHVLDYCLTREEADKLVAEVNQLHSVTAVNACIQKRMESRKK